MIGCQTDGAQAIPPALASNARELRRGTPKPSGEGGRRAIAALKRCATIVVFSSAAAVAADQPALVSAAKNVDREAVRALLKQHADASGPSPPTTGETAGSRGRL